MKRTFKVISFVPAFLLILLIGALAAVNTDRQKSITPELQSYEKINNMVKNKINNGKIDFSNYKMYKDIDFQLYPKNVDKDTAGVFDINSIAGKTAVDLLYYAAYVSVQLNDFNLDTSKLSNEELINIRNKSYIVVDEMFLRMNNFFLQTVGYNNIQKNLLHDMYFNLAFNMKDYLDNNFPQDSKRKFGEEYKNVYVYLETESITLDWAKDAANNAKKEMKQLKKDVESEKISADEGLTKIDSIWSAYVKKETENIPK